MRLIKIMADRVVRSIRLVVGFQKRLTVRGVVLILLLMQIVHGLELLVGTLLAQVTMRQAAIKHTIICNLIVLQFVGIERHD